MARKIKITEQQYRMLMEDENDGKIHLSLGGSNSSNNQNQNDATNPIDKAKETVDALKQKGVNKEDVKFETSVNDLKQQAPKENGDVKVEMSGVEVEKSGATTESKIITIKELKEKRLKVLREHSEYYSLNDFLKTLK